MIKTIIKRDGTREPFMAEKLNKWAQYATKTGGNWSEIALSTYKRLPEVVTSADIHQTMINVCVQKQSIEYSRIAARLEQATIRKNMERFLGVSDRDSFKDIIEAYIKAGLWSADAIPEYNEVWEEWYKEIYPTKLEYWQIVQWGDKYAVKLNREPVETFHIGCIGIALAIHGDTELAFKLAKALIQGKINQPTPVLNGMRNGDFNSISCCVISGGDSVESIAVADHIALMQTARKSGIGIEYTTRSKGAPVKGGAVEHLGKHSIYAALDKSVKLFCYDDETEVLTNRGFVLFSELNESDLVAQVHDDRSLEFVKPSEYVKTEYNGSMYGFSKRGVDINVTANHHMAFRTITYDDKNRQTSSGYIFERADEFTPKRTTAWDFGGELNGTYNELTPLDKLRVAYQADGSLRKNANANDSYIFGVKKNRKVERLVEILTAIGMSRHEDKNMKSGYRQYTGDTIRGEYNYISIKQPDFILEKNLDWVYDIDWSVNAALEFFDELRMWDGDYDIRGGQLCTYNTSDKTCADAVQYVAAISNKRSSLKKYGSTYRVFVYDSDCITGEQTNVNVTQYNGYVYCVTVPTHVLVVRRNGYVNVCGNTQITRGGSATVTYKCIDPEVENIIMWKTQRVDIETRLDKLDFNFAYNDAFLQAVIKNGDWYLFDLLEAPEVHEAFYHLKADEYNAVVQAAIDAGKEYTKLRAQDLLKTMLMARNETGRVYTVNVTRMNEHTPFLDTIRQSNLCVVGDTVVDAQIDGIRQKIKIEDLVNHVSKDIKVKSYNIDTGQIQYKTVTAKAKTAKDAKLVKVKYNGKELICTPEHKVYTTNRGYVESQHLKTDDILILE